jgi:hypothetical protein
MHSNFYNLDNLIHHLVVFSLGVGLVVVFAFQDCHFPCGCHSRGTPRFVVGRTNPFGLVR